MSAERPGNGQSDRRRQDLEALAEGALKLARQVDTRQPDQKRAFEELAAGARRLARRLPAA